MSESKVAGVLKTIATHSGTFHADECLAVFMLVQLDEWKHARIVRSRDPEVLSCADMVVDVGAVCDPTTNRFDHHQREFVETFSPAHTVTKLSSAGLVYKYHGRSVVSKVLGWPLSHESFELVYQKIYENLIEGFDAVDNGVSRFSATIEPLYKDNTSISSRVSRLNMDWNKTLTDDEVYVQFMKAVGICGEEFMECVKHVSGSWLPARELVLEAFNNRITVHSSGKIVIFDTYCSWKDHLYTIEMELGTPVDNKPLYVVYPESGGQWRLQAVSESLGSFASRKALLEPWRGMRDEQLSQLTGIPGCVFVHASGFIGGVKSRQGAIDLATLSL